MKRFPVRMTAAAAALSVTAAFSGVGPAGASTAGVSTTKASTTILGLELGKDGSLLNLRILGDDAQSTIDSLVASPHAFSRLVPASLTSSALPALNSITANLPTFESRTPGGQGEVSGAAVDLGSNPAGLPALPLKILGGSVVPTRLTSALDAGGARSALDAALANLNLVGGVVSLKSVSNTLGTAAAPGVGHGNRAVSVDALSVLDLGELLKGLKIDLAALPVGTISELLKALKLPVTLPTGSPDLASAVAVLQEAIADVTTTVAGSNATLGQIVQDVPAVNEVVAGLPTQLPVSTDTLVNTTTLVTDTVGTTLETLQATLTNLLNNALGSLGNMPLLKLDGATLGVATKAAPTLDASSATAEGKLGKLTVLGLELPGLDLLNVADQLNAITGQLSGVLGIISPDLANLVQVKVLDKTTSVTQSGGYNRALAGIDVLRVSINPPANLAALVSSLTGSSTSSTSILGAAGITNVAGSLPVLGTAMGALNGVVNVPAALGALSQGATLRIASVRSGSDYAAAPVPAAAPAVLAELPRTGGTNGAPLAVLAAGLAALAIGVRRWARRPVAG